MSNTTVGAGETIVDKDGRATVDFAAKWQRLLSPATYLVANLPASARRGAWAYATDLRVFNGAGTQETAGNGTGGLVSFNGTNWKIAGTNVTAVA